MTIYLLIDTNILKRLVSKSGFSSHLKQLNFWVTGRKVTLLVPTVLKFEWARHREIEKDKIELSLQDLKTQARLMRALRDDEVEYIEAQIGELRKEAQSQLDMIDELINKWGLKIEDSMDLQLLISKQ